MNKKDFLQQTVVDLNSSLGLEGQEELRAGNEFLISIHNWLRNNYEFYWDYVNLHFGLLKSEQLFTFFLVKNNSSRATEKIYTYCLFFVSLILCQIFVAIEKTGLIWYVLPITLLFNFCIELFFIRKRDRLFKEFEKENNQIRQNI